LVEEVERNLRLTDSVIRYYSVKMAENVDPAARASELTEESFAKASTPGPDEEEIATGQAQVRSPFEDEEGAFDFEEAVFGSVDEPKPRRGED
jgi:small subunit ribosomal protein S6